MTDVEQSFQSSLEVPDDLPLLEFRITDQEHEVANHAQIEFENCQYGKTVEALDRLSEIRQNDHKVMHNKAVAQFHQSRFTKTDEFYKNLLSIKKQIENETGDNGEESDDLDMAYLLYNEAVVCFGLRQYNAAVCTLNRLFHVIEPLDENLALKVCFLLAELYLIIYKPDKAGVILNHIENLILDSSTLNETSQGNSTLTLKNVDESLKGKFHQLRARQNLLIKSMKGCKREIKEVFNLNSTPNGYFLKSNFEYLRQNYRKSIKLLNSAPKTGSNVLETGESLSTMYFNNLGCIHYQMHKYNLAAFYSRLALEDNDKVLSSLPQTEKNNPLHNCPLVKLRVSQRHEILYNLGIQLLFSGRPQAAFDCLVESIQSYHTNPRLWLRLAECCILAYHMLDDSKEQIQRKCTSEIVRSVIGSGPHRKIIMSSLMTEKRLINSNHESHSAAMPACSLEFSSICLQNALLLLKVGEDNMTSTKHTHNIENHVGKHNFDGLEINGSIEKDNPRKLSSGSIECSISALPGPPIRLKEIPNFRCATLCCSAYVSLGLGDNVTALVHAQRLLEQTNISGSHKFLGHLYAAESLIKLNRISEAITHLSPDNVNDISIGGAVCDGPGGGSEKEDKERDTRPHSCGKMDFPQSHKEGKAALLCNLASTYCLKNEYDKARRCLNQACSLGAQKSLTARMVLLSVYIELKCGNVTHALQMIKKNQFLQISNGKVKQPKRLGDFWKT